MASTGTVSQTFHNVKRDQVVVKLQWLASSISGTLSTVTTDSNISDLLRGMYCVKAVTDPGDTTAPTDGYDIVINDSFGCDIFGGELANRASGSIEQAMPRIGNAYSPALISSPLAMALSNNTVASASGALYLVFTE